MCLTLPKIKNLNKVDPTKVWRELGLKIPRQADLEYLCSHLRLIKLNIESGVSQYSISEQYDN